MKRSILLAVFLVTALTAGKAYALETKTYRWDDKLVRGLLNIVSSPVEIARTIHLTTEDSSLLEGWTIGLVKGLGSGIVRLGAGVLDLVTFPFNFPDDEKGPLVDPEFVWQKPGVNYTA
jgi:putative exosortase-associated protein (TIGR04073 family)